LRNTLLGLLLAFSAAADERSSTSIPSATNLLGGSLLQYADQQLSRICVSPLIHISHSLTGATATLLGDPVCSHPEHQFDLPQIQECYRQTNWNRLLDVLRVSAKTQDPRQSKSFIDCAHAMLLQKFVWIQLQTEQRKSAKDYFVLLGIPTEGEWETCARLWWDEGDMANISSDAKSWQRLSSNASNAKYLADESQFSFRWEQRKGKAGYFHRWDTLLSELIVLRGTFQEPLLTDIKKIESDVNAAVAELRLRRDSGVISKEAYVPLSLDIRRKMKDSVMHLLERY
jgi:hypothetical protein